MKKFLSAVLVFLTCSTFAQIPSYVPTNGLVGYWPFNGNANDEIGGGNNGIVNGATLSSDIFGEDGKAYYFNGINNFIDLPMNFYSGQNTSIASFRFRFKLTSNGDFGIWNKDGSWLEAAIFTSIDGNLGIFWAYPNQYNVIGTRAGAIIPNTWYDAVIIINGLSSKIYLNGIEQTDITISMPSIAIGFSDIGTCGTGINRFGFQKVSCSPTKFLNGFLDEFMLYNRALTQQEVSQLYNGCSTPATSEFSVSACEQYQLPWGGNPVTASGDYTNTYQSISGCDSIVTAHVVINHAVAGSSFNASGISSYTLPWGQEVTTSGYYNHMYQNVNGCDSLVTAYVVINTPPNSGNLNVGINTQNPQRSLHVNDAMRLEPRDTPLDNPSKGDMYFDGVLNKLRVYDGTSWQSCW
jgi:hypothetical protein